MRQITFFALFITLSAAVLWTGCAKKTRHVTTESAPDSPALSEQPATRGVDTPRSPRVDTPRSPDSDRVAGTDSNGKPLDLPPVAPPEASKQEKYDAALLDALNQLAERKYSQALAALEAARSIQDTEQVRQEIDKVKHLIEQQAAAERTAHDIHSVLSQGKADEASRLATTALQQYGATDAAEPLAKLKRQADAVTAT